MHLILLSTGMLYLKILKTYVSQQHHPALDAHRKSLQLVFLQRGWTKLLAHSQLCGLCHIFADLARYRILRYADKLDCLLQQTHAMLCSASPGFLAFWQLGHGES
jgi:hypothetical protein